jgi:hypothetical protein
MLSREGTGVGNVATAAAMLAVTFWPNVRRFASANFLKVFTTFLKNFFIVIKFKFQASFFSNEKPKLKHKIIAVNPIIGV